VLNFAKTRNITVDRNVVRRVGDDKAGLFSAEQLLVCICIGRVAAEYGVITEAPEVANLRNLTFRHHWRNCILICRPDCVIIEDDV
jgi:hypothetical protein